MKHLLVSLLLLVSTVARAELVTIQIPGAPPGLSITVGTGANALPLQNISNNPNAVNISTSDDGWNNVPLGFDFPFFGRSFNNSWAMTNGVVTFQDPIQSGAYGLCCTGVDLRTTTDPRYNYSIFGIHTDLYSWNGQNQYYLREGNSMTYGWYNVSQCCSGTGGNSFEIKINSSGLIDTRIAGARVEYNAVTSGMSGNLANGEYFQAYHGQGLNITAGSPSIFSWQAPNGTGPVDMCIINPLSSPTCSGYQAAYTTQQCTVNALFDPSCPGYAAAYFSQQCSTNPLYNQSCPGYQAAYLQQQCSINPLYSTTCDGYQQAYHNQQCSLNRLYSTDCPGYAQAYLDRQCSINPLYSTTCDGYQQAYFDRQCSLDSLYNRLCPGYAQAYATKMLLEQQGTASTVATAGVIARNDPANTATTTPTADSSGEIKVAVVADPIVNSAITTTATSASPAQAATATVPLAAPPAPAPEPAPKKAEPANDKPAGGPTQMAQGPQGGGDKPAQPTARQQLAERRAEAAKKDAVEKGKNLANEMGKAADMESQKQVQNVVIQAMGFTPGFDNYNKTMIPDTTFYKPVSVYNNQKNIDNRANLRMWTGTDRLHNEMVDSQYNKGN
jgi:hypothetical protein